MSAATRVETSRTACECGQGAFIFYTCEADKRLYVYEPREKWFEMHILCETCARLFQKHKLTIFSQGDEEPHWKIVIPEPDRVPPH